MGLRGGGEQLKLLDRDKKIYSHLGNIGECTVYSGEY